MYGWEIEVLLCVNNIDKKLEPMGLMFTGVIKFKFVLHRETFYALKTLPITRRGNRTWLLVLSVAIGQPAVTLMHQVVEPKITPF